MRAIDFGTSSTAAAHRGPGGTPELVTFGGAHAFPSTAAIDHGELICGEEAEALLPADPSAGTRAPKLILANDPHGVCFLGGKEVEVVEVVAAILREAAVGDHASDDGWRMLTCPADWEPEGPRMQLLSEAAERAGLEDVLFMWEPSAVAWHAAERIPVGMRFCVFDLGGGTCDMAALERRHGFEVIARPHSEPIGGELVDALLFELVMEKLAHELPEETSHLRAAARARAEGVGHADAASAELARWQGCLLGTERAIRSAKVRLSRDEEAVVRIPPPASARLAITRSELSSRVRPSLERAADALSTVMAEADLDPEGATVMLSGAASVMPVVRDVLAERTGARIEPVTPSKGAVSLGALRALEEAIGNVPTLSAGWRAKATSLQTLEPVKLPFETRLACLTPDGELVLAGERSIAAMSGATRAWEHRVESRDNDDFPTALACAPDGTVALGTYAGQLISIGPGGAPVRKLMEAKFFRNPNPLWEMTFTALGEDAVWMVAREDTSVRFVSPEGKAEPLSADAAAHIDTKVLRLATLPGFSNVALLTWRRLLLFGEELTVVENCNPNADSTYWHLSIGLDGTIAVAHTDGTVDLVSGWMGDYPTGEMLGGFRIADAQYPHVALLAERVIVASHNDAGCRVDLFDREGTLLAQTLLEDVEEGTLWVDRQKGIVWVVDSLKAHRLRLRSE